MLGATTGGAPAALAIMAIGVVSARIATHLTKSKITGSPFYQQIWDGVTSFPEYAWAMLSGPAGPPQRWDISDEEDIPQVLLCPIGHAPMVDPALLFGQYYDYENVARWVRANGVDPYRRECTVNDIVRCKKMQALVQRFARERRWALI
eukprot:TRINITY_DN10823_c1_g1_i1.p2 TRINITY_DN10823_c1_g1~~TRINITY_DN10823_c1_g1_i1.p2  ORF type:complete len:164 (-),score=24.27 TRINITY_DN10823_c1_g1_i1:81-527(-)